MGRVIYPHLALADARETVAPEVVPDRQPAFAEGAREHAHEPEEELRHIASDRHRTADADRPEPQEQSRNRQQHAPGHAVASPRGLPIQPEFPGVHRRRSRHSVISLVPEHKCTDPWSTQDGLSGWRKSLQRVPRFYRKNDIFGMVHRDRQRSLAVRLDVTLLSNSTCCIMSIVGMGDASGSLRVDHLHLGEWWVFRKGIDSGRRE